VIAYTPFLSQAVFIFSTGNAGMDGDPECWPIHEAILGLQDTWHPSCRPEIFSANDPDLLQYIYQDYPNSCVEEAKAIEVAGYKQVLEYGPEEDMTDK
jgi:hypothetical protein